MIMALSAALIYPFVSHLTDAQERQRREEFGSSLKRLKWDEREQKAVETRNGAERADSGEVIRVETSLAVFDILPLDKDRRAGSGLGKGGFFLSQGGGPRGVRS